MAVTNRPLASAGVPAPAPLRTPASSLSQVAVAAALCLTFVALGLRLESAIWFAAPTVALVAGIALGRQLDSRSLFARLPGVVLAVVVFLLLSLLWLMALGWLEVELPYAVIPLAALVTVGADWWWVERLRPTAVGSGLVMVVLVSGGSSPLPLALGWFGLVAAALWSLRADVLRAVPTPVPVDRSATSAVGEPGAGRTVIAVVGSWLVAAAVVALASLIPLGFDSPETEGRLGAGGIGGPGSGSGASGDRGEDQTGGGDIGPGGVVDGGEIEDAVEDRDVNGDGIPDPDVNGDGIPDVDLDGDLIPDIDLDGDGVPDDPTAPGGDDPGTTPTPADVGSTGGGSTSADDVGGRRADVLRVVGIVVVVLLVLALLVVAGRALAWERVRRRALRARPWAVRLTERLEDEGSRRGRSRRRDEPVTHYAAALAGGVLAHDRLGEVGDALSVALFGAGTPSDSTGEWAVGVVDEAVAANPAPTWWDSLKERLPRRGGRRR